jgi:N4-gp56 family major capsid protein
MSNVTKFGDISGRTAGAISRMLLDRGQYLLVIERFGQTDVQGKNQGLTRRYRRYEAVQRATQPLAEGVTPPGQKLSYTDIITTLEQYGDLIEITDVVADTHEDPVIKESVKVLSEQIAETVEAIRINAIKNGTNVFYAAGVALRSLVNSKMLKNDLRNICRSFSRNKARTISEVIAATAKVGTEPVAAGFFAMGHTDLDSDLRDVAGYVEPAKYSESTKALPAEAGKVEGIRFLLTALFDPWLAAGVAGTSFLSNGVKPSAAAACDVYPVLVVARDAYSIVPLQGANAITPTVLNPTPDKSDPLGQRGFISWKTYQACAILQQLWLARYEVAASVLS